MEIEVAQKLMKFADQYHIPQGEIDQTAARLKDLLLKQ
jgi:hypothetical protein